MTIRLCCDVCHRCRVQRSISSAPTAVSLLICSSSHAGGRMAGSKMSFSYDAIGSEILRADCMVEHMRARAQLMLTAAWDRAPVHTGADPGNHRGPCAAVLL